MIRHMYLFLLISMPAMLTAQKVTISGNIRDASTGEDLIGATILAAPLQGVGTFSNEYGFFSLTLPPSSYTIQVRYAGYRLYEQEVDLQISQRLTIELAPLESTLEVVEIVAEKENSNVSDTQMGLTKFNPKEIETVPVLFGEKDIIKVIQLSPGVKTAGEGNTGFFVRGGGLDQNLILLDEAVVYNPSHLLGFFSVFNSDAIKDVSLFKGGMPAEYGGRASSVLDIRMKEGNKKEYDLSGGIGLISSRLTFEGPIQKDKSSFIISGRRTYLDLFLGLSSDEAIQNSNLFFYDLNTKANLQLGEKDRLFISGYFGQDNFGFGDEFGFNWGNATGTLRWNHLFSDRLFSNTSLIFSRYTYEFNFGTGDEAFGLESVIQDFSLKQDFSLFANAKQKLKFGFQATRHRFEPGNINAGSESSFNDEDTEPKYANEGGLYLQLDQTVSERFSFNIGLRYSIFDYVGPGTSYTFNSQGEVLSEESFEDGESIEFYHGLEPRLSMKYQLDENRSIKASYNRNYQYLHLLTNSTTSTPTDVWVPSSNNVKPQIADQVSLGYFQNFMDNTYEFSVETYYKNLQNQIDYRTGADLFINNTIESELVFGSGYAYGLELYLRKRKGTFTGWVSYTLSRTLREFDEINNGDPFPARQDRIHDLSVVANYNLTSRLSLSANFIYYTGDAVTYPAGRYTVDEQIVPYYTERNGERIPDYHRLDLGVTLRNKPGKRVESSWNFSLYNAYGRENAFSIEFRENEDDPTRTEAVKTALFKWVPSVTYNFSF